jgi:membrane-bound ClpP family serine protease
MESLLVWGLVLFGISALLLVVELFVPTGGALGITAAVVAIAGVVCLFRHDTGWGFAGLLAVLVLGPAALVFGLQVWPNTPMGRRIIGVPTEEEQERTRLAEEADRKRANDMIGQEGVVLTDLRPVGIVEIGGRRLDVLSETLFVPAGSRVRVTHVEGSMIKVRPVA